jgi:Fe2+ transport system protein FeoA
MKTLRDVHIGETVRVVKIHGHGNIRRRVMDMGITKNADIFIRKMAPLGILSKSMYVVMNLAFARMMPALLKFADQKMDIKPEPITIAVAGNPNSGKPRFSTL